MWAQAADIYFDNNKLKIVELIVIILDGTTGESQCKKSFLCQYVTDSDTLIIVH